MTVEHDSASPTPRYKLRDAAGVGFGLALAVLVVGGLLGYYNARRLAENRALLVQTHQAIGSLETLLSTIKDAETGQRGYLLAENDNYLAPYNEALGRVERELDQIRQLTSDNSQQQARLILLEQQIKLRLDELRQTVASIKAGDRAAALELVRADTGKALMDNVRQQIGDMQQAELELLRQRNLEIDASHRIAVISIILSSCLGILLVGIAFYLSQHAIRQRQRAADVLAEQKERLRTTLGSIGDAVIATDQLGYITNMNAVAESLTGWSNAAAIGQPLAEVFNIVNESTRQTVENPAMRALREGVIVGLANHTVLIAKDGTERPIDDSAAPIRCREGKIVGCVLVFRDISARWQTERTVAEQARITALRADIHTALATTENVPAALQHCAAALVRHLDMAFARVWTLNESRAELELQASAGQYTHLDGPHSRVKVGEFKIGRIASTRQPHLTNSLLDNSNVGDPDWARREGLVAFAGYPLVANNRVLGVVAMFARRPLSDELLSELSPLVESIGIYLERRQTEVALRESEALKTAIVDTALDCIISCDHAGRIIEFNPAAERTFGYRRQDVIGQAMSDIVVPPSLRRRHLRGMERYLKTRQSHILGKRLVMTGLRADRSEFPVEFSITVISTDGPPQFTAHLRDISDRKQSAERERLLLAESAAANAKFQAFFEQGSLFAGIADLNGTLLEANRLSLDGCGYTREQVIGKPFWQCPWWSPAPELVERVKQASIMAAAGDMFRAEMPYFVADGSQRIADVSILPIKDDGGRVMFLAPTGADITDRKRAEQKVFESEHRLRFIMDSMPQKIFTATPQGNVDYFNPVWMEFTGLPLEKIKDWGWKQFIHPDDLQENIRVWQHAISTGMPFQFEHRFQRADGEYRWHISRAKALKDVQGQVVMWVGSNTDIHEQRQTAEDLRQLTAELSEADRRKDEFLATLAHELRNPLAPIRNGLEIMRLSSAGGETVSEAVEQARSMMERQIAQMVHLVDDLLDLSRVSRGKLELRQERVELATVLNNAVETSRPVIESGVHELVVNVPAEPIVVYGDVTRLGQVFANLLNNAAKYSERGARISLSAACHDNEVVICVQDTGIGIPSEMLPKIFDMFTQVDHSLERSQGGLGIGLTLVKRLVELHGGNVQAFSAGHGQGSEFVVRLPLAGQTGQEVAPLPTKSDTLATPTKLRVLVADDNVDAATTLAMMLKIMGNEVRTAHDGLQAVELAGEFRPQAILLDIGMPKLNGYEACRNIRAQPWGQQIYLIALTGWGQDEDRRKSEEAGFDQHLVKPVDPAALDKLLAKVRTISGQPPMVGGPPESA